MKRVGELVSWRWRTNANKLGRKLKPHVVYVAGCNTTASLHCVSKTAQLWNGIARNDMDRFWWYLVEISRTLGNRVCMFRFSCRFACNHIIVSQTAYWKRVHAVRFSQLLSAPFLVALETQIFVNNPRNWWSMDPPASREIFLTVRWLWGLFSWLSKATQLCRRFHQYTHCVCRWPDACRLFCTSPAAYWCCSSSNLCSEILL